MLQHASLLLQRRALDLRGLELVVDQPHLLLEHVVLLLLRTEGGFALQAVLHQPDVSGLLLGDPVGESAVLKRVINSRSHKEN